VGRGGSDIFFFLRGTRTEKAGGAKAKQSWRENGKGKERTGDNVLSSRLRVGAEKTTKNGEEEGIVAESSQEVKRKRKEGNSRSLVEEERQGGKNTHQQCLITDLRRERDPGKGGCRQ